MGITIEQLAEMQRRLERNRAPKAPSQEPPIAIDTPKRVGGKGPRAKVPPASGYNRQIVLAAFQGVGIEAPLFEYRFHPVRLWRFDLAWPGAKLAVEVQGGIWKGKPCPTCGRKSGGRHNSGAGLVLEHEKLNAAAAAGWRVMFVEPKDLLKAEFASQLRAALVQSD